MARGTESLEQRKRRLRSAELASARTIVENRAQYPVKSLIVSWAERELAYADRILSSLPTAPPAADSIFDAVEVPRRKWRDREF